MLQCTALLCGYYVIARERIPANAHDGTMRARSAFQSLYIIGRKQHTAACVRDLAAGEDITWQIDSVLKIQRVYHCLASNLATCLPHCRSDVSFCPPGEEIYCRVRSCSGASEQQRQPLLFPLRFYPPCPARERTEGGTENPPGRGSAQRQRGGLFCVSFGACGVHELTKLSRPWMKAACVLYIEVE